MTEVSDPTASPPPGKPPLPIDPHLPGICAALGREGAAVVVAPPGSGKTTRIPPALLAAGLLGEGICVVLEPRRIAARAAARWVAEENGWRLGREVGYQVRHDRCGTGETRIWFVTEGVLVARLQADPELSGVAAVVLDEFHERSLEADLALAFLREVREALRPDLKVLVCSATLDPEPVARFLGAPVLEVPGRPHPVEVVYLEKPDPDPLPSGRPGGCGGPGPSGPARRATCSPSCPARPRSGRPPAAWPTGPPVAGSRSCPSTATFPPPARTRRSGPGGGPG
ncbi:DEAD/DEAH box helicase [Deferrisoma sp.]